MRKSRSPRAGSCDHETELTVASAGASRPTREQKSPTAQASPSTAMTTPCAQFATDPPSPRPRASVYT